ncbi:DNA-binding protein [Sporolactobacillus shoreae]|uniref:DNA-binding protein n=1 Tax=Sporolactobacillus shoreae TaxID=1465501 RepID=A0A4Z0GMP4_9BACL|nr:helix-turn-helix domain-containing protein [Sporolactobacillus shoreae]TGA97395.1 DNA-binding protein [Sporolactobacillus shoreae]
MGGAIDMPTLVFDKSKEYIAHAFKEKDSAALQKEAVFLINTLATSIPNIFSDYVRYVAVRRPVYKIQKNFLPKYETEYLKFLELLTTKMGNKSKDLGNVKLEFNKFFLNNTDEGFIDFDYQTSELLSVDETAHLLSCSKQSVYNYLKRGLEFQTVNNVAKIPRSTVELWKDPRTAFEIQWVYQQNQLRKQTHEDKYDRIQSEIAAFEKKYGDTFENIYGSFTEDELDGRDEAVDISDWKELIMEKKDVLYKIKQDRDNAKSE